MQSHSVTLTLRPFLSASLEGSTCETNTPTEDPVDPCLPVVFQSGCLFVLHRIELNRIELSLVGAWRKGCFV